MADNTNNKRKRIVICGKGGGMSTVTWDDIQDKPEFATVATSGDYDDLTDKPTIPAAQVNSDWNSNSGVAQILNKPNLATVATTGSYNDLTDKPTILTQWFGTQAEYDAIAVKDPNTVYNIEGSDNVQPDWNQNDTTADDYIKNKPTIPAAQVNSDWNAVSGVAQILNKPNLATVATTGNYSDLNGTPTIPAAPVQSNWNESDSTSLAYIQNKPTIPAAQVNADWNSASGVAQILNKPTLATVATSGDYNDLSNKPTIPAAQVNADWNSNSGVAQILNKPTIPTVPIMTTETLTFTLQGGTVKTIEFYTKPMSANYFYVEDLSGVPNDVTIMCGDMIPIFDIYTSTDQTNWNYLGTTGDFVTLTETIPLNGKLYFKAVTDSWTGGIQISCSHSHKIGGNIMSLLYGDNYFDTTLHPDYNINAFSGLFMFDSELVDASDLVLPSNVVMGCYGNMFSGCTSLTAAPALPATTLTDSCYNAMFYGCTNLNSVTTYAQDISATGCLYNWLDNVAATGDFYNLGGATYTSGVDGIPSGWTEHTSL